MCFPLSVKKYLSKLYPQRFCKFLLNNASIVTLNIIRRSERILRTKTKYQESKSRGEQDGPTLPSVEM